MVDFYSYRLYIGAYNPKVMEYIWLVKKIWKEYARSRGSSGMSTDVKLLFWDPNDKEWWIL